MTEQAEVTLLIWVAAPLPAFVLPARALAARLAAEKLERRADWIAPMEPAGLELEPVPASLPAAPVRAGSA